MRRGVSGSSARWLWIHVVAAAAWLGRRAAPTAATALILALAAATDAPAADPFDSLGDSREQLERAKQHADDEKRFRKSLERAARAKEAFIEAAFGGRTLFGACSATFLIIRLDLIDQAIERAAHREFDDIRREDLRAARDFSRDVADTLSGCAPGSPAASRARTLDSRVLKLFDRQSQGKLSGKGLKAGAGQVLRLKTDLLAGETIDGCLVTELFVLIERIDRLIVRARATNAKDFEGEQAKRKATKERRELVEKALDSVRELGRTYAKRPCGGVSVPPPPPPPTNSQPICNGTLGAAPPPDHLTDFVVNFSCRQPATSMGFELPGGRTIQDWIAPAALPFCQPFTNNQTGNKVLICGNGNLPANQADSVRIEPSTQLDDCDRVRIFHNPTTNPTPFVVDTNAFATCP